MMRHGDIVKVTQGGLTRPGIYAGEIGGGLVGVHGVGQLSALPEMVLAGHVDPWHCLRDGHVVTAWDIGDGVRKGTCEACHQDTAEPYGLPALSDRKVICGLCEGSGRVQSVHQHVAGARGTRPCPACSAIMDEST